MVRRKVIVYIAASLDGFIAGENDDLSFLNSVHKEGEDYGYTAFMQTVDTVIMGRKTYEWVIKNAEFPHKGPDTYIITRQSIPPKGNIQFYNKPVSELIDRLRSQKGKNIFCDGGAQLVQTLLNERLVDEMIISFIPVLLGKGIRLFDHLSTSTPLKLVGTKTFDTGLIQLHYIINPAE